MPRSNNHHVPALGTVFELLSAPVRRQLLYYCQEPDQQVASLDELVEHVYSETEAPNSPERTRMVLVHRHLPKLADYGVIEYDQRSETVRYRDNHHLKSVGAFAAEHEQSH